MRSGIALLLLAALTAGGCDRQSATSGQANQGASAQSAAPQAAPAANETVVEEVIGTLDRSHKGTPGPTTPFASPTGAKMTLADFRGHPVLLNLWATWCVPCVKEMPTLDAVAATFDGRIQVVAVSQDQEGAAKVGPFFQKAGFKKLQPYLDVDSALSLGMGVNLPTTILYDSQGNEVWRMLGGMDWTGQTAQELIAEAR